MSKKNEICPESNQKSFSLPATRENVYGRYVHATYFSQLKKLLLGGFMFLIFTCFAVYIATHPQDFSGEEYYNGYEVFSLRSIITRRVILPISYPSVIIFSVISYLIVPPQFRRAIEAFDYAWLKSFRWYANKAKPKFHSVAADRMYLQVRERMADDAVLGHDSIRFTRADGTEGEIAYEDVDHAYRRDGLMVFQVGPTEEPREEVVVDMRPLKGRARHDFEKFVDLRLPKTCRFHYTHYVEPAGDPDRDATESDKTV